MSVGGKCKNRTLFRAGGEQNRRHTMFSESHSPFLPLADLDLPFKLRPPPTTLDNLLFLSGGELRKEMDRVAQEREASRCELCLADNHPFVGLGLDGDKHAKMLGELNDRVL